MKHWWYFSDCALSHAFSTCFVLLCFVYRAIVFICAHYFALTFYCHSRWWSALLLMLQWIYANSVAPDLPTFSSQIWTVIAAREKCVCYVSRCDCRRRCRVCRPMWLRPILFFSDSSAALRHHDRLHFQCLYCPLKHCPIAPRALHCSPHHPIPSIAR